MKNTTLSNSYHNINTDYFALLHFSLNGLCIMTTATKTNSEKNMLHFKSVWLHVKIGIVFVFVTVLGWCIWSLMLYVAGLTKCQVYIPPLA